MPKNGNISAILQTISVNSARDNLSSRKFEFEFRKAMFRPNRNNVSVRFFADVSVFRPKHKIAVSVVDYLKLTVKMKELDYKLNFQRYKVLS